MNFSFTPRRVQKFKLRTAGEDKFTPPVYATAIYLINILKSTRLRNTPSPKIFNRLLSLMIHNFFPLSGEFDADFVNDIHNNFRTNPGLEG